ncbi:MAG: peptidoglycan-binding domain-containing protein, partial [Tistlia sp.]
MKTLSLGVAAFALLAAAPLSATTALAGSLDSLRAGAYGSGVSAPGAVQLAFDAEVQRVQRGLNRLGYDAGPTDGLMGSRTRSAIRDYQRDNDLLVTGQASASLSAHIRDNVRAERADRGSDSSVPAETEATVERQTILQLQSDLRRLGYSVPVVSGTVDSATSEAIRAYQRDNNLLVDGRLSGELVAHVQGKTSAGAVIEDRPTTRSVQAALNERGYDAGPADGIMGTKTRDAIRTFQSDASLPLSGTISKETLVALGLAEGAEGESEAEA